MKALRLGSLVPLLLALTAGIAAADDATPVSVGVTDAVSREQIERLPTTDIADVINRMPSIRELPRSEAGVHVFYQDVHALIPSGGPGTPVYSYGGSVIGVGGQYTYRPNVDSGFYLRGIGGYGIGSEKLEVGGTFSFTDKVTFKSIYGSAAGGIVVPITRHAAGYGQGGVFYSTTKATFDDGTDEVDGEPFKVFGLDTSLGLRYSIGGRNSIFLEQYSQYGWGSGEDGDAKYNETVKYGCFRGGLNFGF